MASKAKRPCNHIGCRELTTDSYCEAHKRVRDQWRGTAHQRGYNHKWRVYSKAFLKRKPLCACNECKQLPVPLPANVVDHIRPHKGDSKLFWDKENHQPMNKRCHDRKTATEDGGFNNPQR